MHQITNPRGPWINVSEPSCRFVSTRLTLCRTEADSALEIGGKFGESGFGTAKYRSWRTIRAQPTTFNIRERTYAEHFRVVHRRISYTEPRPISPLPLPPERDSLNIYSIVFLVIDTLSKLLATVHLAQKALDVMCYLCILRGGGEGAVLAGTFRGV